MGKSELLTLAEVAAELRITRDHARSLCVAGKLPFVNVGTTDTRVIYRVNADAVREFKRREQRKTIGQHVADVRETMSVLKLAETGPW